MGLYETYMASQEVAKQAAVTNEVDEARIQVILEKTAEAENMIKSAGITEYTTEDLADVVTALITNDIEAEEEAEKIAQLVDMGKIMFRGFDEEMQATIEARKQS